MSSKEETLEEETLEDLKDHIESIAGSTQYGEMDDWNWNAFKELIDGLSNERKEELKKNLQADKYFFEDWRGSEKREFLKLLKKSK